MDCAIIDMADAEFTEGLAYTAISRVKEFLKLAFDPFKGYKRFTSFAKRQKFQQRKDEMKRLQELEAQTLARLEAQSQMEVDHDSDEFLTADEEMEVDKQ